jgi:hypothetical protein
VGEHELKSRKTKEEENAVDMDIVARNGGDVLQAYTAKVRITLLK